VIPRRVVALACWAFLAWMWLTWTVTGEMYAVGAGVAVGTALLLAPLGEVVGIWRLLDPRRLIAMAVMAAQSAGKVVLANVDLARRVWSPSLPLTPGLVIVPTRMRSHAELSAMGVVTSLIVDNQIIDMDPSRSVVLFHCIEVPGPDPEERRAEINGSTERAITRISRS